MRVCSPRYHPSGSRRWRDPGRAQLHTEPRLHFMVDRLAWSLISWSLSTIVAHHGDRNAFGLGSKREQCSQCATRSKGREDHNATLEAAERAQEIKRRHVSQTTQSLCQMTQHGPIRPPIAAQRRSTRPLFASSALIAPNIHARVLAGELSPHAGHCTEGSQTFAIKRQRRWLQARQLERAAGAGSQLRMAPSWRRRANRKNAYFENFEKRKIQAAEFPRGAGEPAGAFFPRRVRRRASRRTVWGNEIRRGQMNAEAAE